MDFVIILSIIIAYSNLVSKINKLTNIKNVSTKKTFPSIKELLNKNIEVEMDNDTLINNIVKGILIECDDEWLVLETVTKKDKKELFYYRIDNITSINIIEK